MSPLSSTKKPEPTPPWTELPLPCRWPNGSGLAGDSVLTYTSPGSYCLTMEMVLASFCSLAPASRIGAVASPGAAARVGVAGVVWVVWDCAATASVLSGAGELALTGWAVPGSAPRPTVAPRPSPTAAAITAVMTTVLVDLAISRFIRALPV